MAMMKRIRLFGDNGDDQNRVKDWRGILKDDPRKEKGRG